MIFSCGYSREHKRQVKYDKCRIKAEQEAEKMRNWCYAFAWLPKTIKITDGKKTCVWLERYWLKYPYARARYDDWYTDSWVIDTGIVLYKTDKEIKDDA